MGVVVYNRGKVLQDQQANIVQYHERKFDVANFESNAV